MMIVLAKMNDDLNFIVERKFRIFTGKMILVQGKAPVFRSSPIQAFVIHKPLVHSKQGF